MMSLLQITDRGRKLRHCLLDIATLQFHVNRANARVVEFEKVITSWPLIVYQAPINLYLLYSNARLIA